MALFSTFKFKPHLADDKYQFFDIYKYSFKSIIPKFTLDKCSNKTNITMI